MSAGDLAALYLEIEGFLKVIPPAPGTADTAVECSRAFWRSRPYLTTPELRALATLVEEPSCAQALACRLGRDLADAQAFLDALVSIGTLEREEERYALTPTARLYLKTFLNG